MKRSPHLRCILRKYELYCKHPSITCVFDKKEGVSNLKCVLFDTPIAFDLLQDDQEGKSHRKPYMSDSNEEKKYVLYIS